MTSPPPDSLLADWLARQAPDTACAWLEQKLAALRSGEAAERALFLAFGQARRRFGDDDLALTPADLEAARGARPGWDPSAWTLVDAARARCLLAWPAADGDALTSTLDTIAKSADMRELVALYQALPLLPFPEAHRLRAAEGLRTNMKGVFCAVAHRNPFPREALSEAAWNQMVLKALFIGVALAPIQGLGERANERLTAMLSDYAHERWAAGREVSPELWRPAAMAPTDAAIEDMRRVLREGTETERVAVHAALAASPDPRAQDLLRDSSTI
jgi:hypothetical protein